MLWSYYCSSICFWWPWPWTWTLLVLNNIQEIALICCSFSFRTYRAIHWDDVMLNCLRSITLRSRKAAIQKFCVQMTACRISTTIPSISARPTYSSYASFPCEKSQKVGSEMSSISQQNMNLHITNRVNLICLSTRFLYFHKLLHPSQFINIEIYLYVYAKYMSKQLMRVNMKYARGILRKF